MFIICPNKWSSVYHLAEPAKRPGEFKSWCHHYSWARQTMGTNPEQWADSTALQPIAVENIPSGLRLCRACARLRLTSVEEILEATK